MIKDYRKSADLAEENFFACMVALANTRLSALCSEWRSRYPKSSLTISFGLMPEQVSVNGTHVVFWKEENVFLKTAGHLDLQFVQDAIEDVWYITDDYKRGVPDDIEVLPDDSELTGGPNGERKQTSDHRDIGEDIPDYEKWPGYRCPRPGLPGDAVYVFPTK